MSAGTGRPLVGARLTIVLAVVLLVPFGFKLATDTEPYPALVFPAGPGVVTTRDGIVQYDALELYGADASGELQQIDPVQFLEPIPTHYLRDLADSEFGTLEGDDLTVRVRRIGWTLSLPRPPVSDADREATRSWLGDRLEAVGLERDELVVRRVRIAADADDGTEISRETIEETVIDV
jgi:hypothetical protein